MDKIAIMLGNLKMEPYQAMQVVADLGVPGVHLSATGQFAPDKMDLAARKQLLRHLRGLGLEISAVSAWGGEVDLCEADKAARNIAWAKHNIDMTLDLECTIWQGHIGILPVETSDPKWQVVVDTAGEIARYAASRGACLAIETGPEPPAVLERLIETLDYSTGLRINYDPANLILWPARYMKDKGIPYSREQATAEFEPVEGVKRLGKYVVHTHAKDALVHPDGRRQEVPLGTGWVEWPRYVSLLREAGYDGYFAIERETGEDPVGDITRAVGFLRTL